MRITALLLAVATVIIAACVPAPPRAGSVSACRRTYAATIHGDTRFLPEERMIAEQAFRSVNEDLTRGCVRLAVAWDFSEIYFLSLADDPHLIRTPGWMPPQHVAGAYTDALRVSPERCPGARLLPCFEHEIGHFLGLEHPEFNAPHSVMQPRNPGARWTHSDRHECERVRFCSVLIPEDVTTVTVTIDPDVAPVEPTYPRPAPF